MSRAGVSRWLREGPLAARVPWRARTGLERWTAERGYPRVGADLAVHVADEPVAATLLFGGDVALHRWPAGALAGDVFAGLAPVLETGDARFYNLESQLTARTEPAGTVGAFLRAAPTAVAALQALGATAVTCANNHCLDHGADALAESVALLEASGIAACGVSRGADSTATVVRVNGVRVGMLAYSDDWHELEDARALPRPAAHEPERVRADIAAARRAADIVAVQLHWGWEWTMWPPLTLRDLARSYAEAGADLVICHHAHVPSGVERWRDGVIAHGLGNLYFGAKRWAEHPFASDSFVLRVAVSARRVVRAEVVPIHTTPAGELVVSAGAARDRMLRAIGYLSARLDARDYARRVECRATAMHAALMLRDLAARVAAGDARGANERIRFLRCPRQRWLLAELRRRPADRHGRATSLTDGARLLADLLESPGALDQPAVRDRIAATGEAADRWLRRAVAIGRLP